MKEIKKLNPFGRFCCTIGNLPTSYMLSLTYEEQLLWLCKFLEETVIPVVNQNTEDIEELQTLFVELKTYVDNYLDNLDIQTEIDAKLDEMAESGELTDIIAQYLQLAGILAYNTKSDLKGAENLSNGSFTKTYGELTYNDGKGAFYKIRGILNTDVIDDDNIIALTNYPELIAEKMPDYTINYILNNMPSELVVFGDSWSSANIATNQWAIKLASNLNLNLNNYSVSGAGFVEPNDKLISTQVTTFLNSSVVKTKVKYIVFMGGINDFRLSVNANNLGLAVKTEINRVISVCPNAKILFVSNCQYPYTLTQSRYWKSLHKYLSSEVCVSSLNLDLTIANNFFDSTSFHITQAGQLWLSQTVYSCLTGGQLNYLQDIRTLSDEYADVNIGYTKQDFTLIVSITINVKTAFTSHTFSTISPDLPYGGDVEVFGGIGRSANVLTAFWDATSFLISGASSLQNGRKYYLTFTLPID